jgi:ribosomal-protein-alanine N-acetyltransferase
MHLVAYDPRNPPPLPAAPGWPHADTADGLRFAELGGWTWLVVDDDGRVAGECGVKAAPGPDGTVEIGYGLAPASRGRGLGRRVVAALVDELRTRDGVRAIGAEVHVTNTASRRVLETAGFTVDEVDGPRLRYLLTLTDH